MRLTCPACSAQYEVPSNVIPEEGREVQCSNCDETWFQENPEMEASGEAPMARVHGKSALEKKGVQATDVPRGEPETEPEPERADDADTVPDAAGAQSVARKKLDPNVADVLREEAELEARARRNEIAGSVESQPDLGLPDATAKEQPTVMQAGAGLPVKPPAKQGPETGSGTQNLPDIEGLNSTLRSNDSRPADDPGQTAQTEEREKRGFRSGFTLVIALAAVCVLIYAFAPNLAKGIPEADPWLSAYVASVDEGRMWLNAQLRDVLSWLNTGSTGTGDQK